MSDKLNDITKGVADSWDFWLSQHDYSVPDRIEDAVKSAFSRWLDDHTAELIAAIADRNSLTLETKGEKGVTRRPRTMQEIIDSVNELADQIEAYEPKPEDRRDPEPLKRLREAISASATAEYRIAKAVRACRDANYSWTLIGGPLGMPGEAAKYKYGRWNESENDNDKPQLGN